MNLPALERLGRAGVVGIGCLLFSLAFYLGSVVPAQDALNQMLAETRELAAASARARSPGGAEDGAGAAPAISEAPEVLKRLYGLAEKHRMLVEQVSYGIKTEAGGRRLDVSFPLKLSYPVLRAYLSEALALTATASLDELSLQRASAEEANLDAQLRLSYRFSAVP